MPDNLIVPPPPSLYATGHRSARPDLSRPVLVQVAIIVAAFIVGGLAAGLAAATLWTPPTGMVLEDKWYRGLISIDPPAIGQNIDQGVFAATAWFSVCAIVLGLLVGIAAAVWLNRSELVTLGALMVIFLMWAPHPPADHELDGQQSATER